MDPSARPSHHRCPFAQPSASAASVAESSADSKRQCDSTADNGSSRACAEQVGHCRRLASPAVGSADVEENGQLQRPAALPHACRASVADHYEPYQCECRCGAVMASPPPPLVAQGSPSPMVKPRPSSKRNVRLTMNKPSDVKKRTVVPARQKNGRTLIIDERSVAQRSSIIRLRPALCEMCGARVPVARLSRNGFNFWSCKLCVRAAREEFVQFGTLSRSRLTIKTRSPSALSRATLPAPASAAAVPVAAAAVPLAAAAVPVAGATAAVSTARPAPLMTLESTFNVNQTMTKPAPLMQPPRSPDRAEVNNTLAQLPSRPAPSPQAQVRRGPMPPARRMQQQQQQPARQPPARVVVPRQPQQAPPNNPNVQSQQQTKQPQQHHQQLPTNLSPRSQQQAAASNQEQQQQQPNLSPRSQSPQVPPPHQQASSPPPPLKPKLTPLGFALDISDIEELLESSTDVIDHTASFTERTDPSMPLSTEDLDDDEDRDDADSINLEELYDRFTLRRSYATVGAAKPFDIAAINNAASAANSNKEQVSSSDDRDTSSFRLMHGDVHSVHFFDNEEEIFAQLDDIHEIDEALPPLPNEN